MKRIRKTLSFYLVIAFFAAFIAVTANSCNRMITYEDGMFDDNEIYFDNSSENFQINSEIENDDQERY